LAEITYPILLFLLLLTLIPLSGVGTTCFLSYCDIQIQQLFFDRPPSWRLHSLKLNWVLTTANVTEINGLTCLPKHGRARYNKFWSPIRFYLFLSNFFSSFIYIWSSFIWSQEEFRKNNSRSIIVAHLFYTTIILFVIVVRRCCINIMVSFGR
jgi:hypothetical protein